MVHGWLQWLWQYLSELCIKSQTGDVGYDCQKLAQCGDIAMCWPYPPQSLVHWYLHNNSRYDMCWLWHHFIDWSTCGLTEKVYVSISFITGSDSSPTNGCANIDPSSLWYQKYIDHDDRDTWCINTHVTCSIPVGRNTALSCLTTVTSNGSKYERLWSPRNLSGACNMGFMPLSRM